MAEVFTKVLRSASAFGLAAVASAALAAPAPASTIAGGHSATVTERAERGAMVPVAHPAFPGPAAVHLGVSAQGRPITAFHRRGSLTTDRTVVVVGVIHGDELHGRLVTDQLMTAALPEDLDLWIVPTMNPDGEALGVHQNGRGVDLNRNWPANWATGTTQSSGKHHSGALPASEFETQVMMQFFQAASPDVTIWYHAPWNRVDCNETRVGTACAGYASAVGTSSWFVPRPGTATDWIMTAGHGVSFIQEFAASAPSPESVQRHVSAVLDLSRV